MNKIVSFYLLLFSVTFAVHLGSVKIGKARLTGIENQQPVAYIDSIKPSPVDSGVTVYFGGHGTDDGTIAAYDWDSNQDGQLSTLEAFNKSDLSVNAHTIWFKVQDNFGMWSDSVSENITITEPTPPPVYAGAEWWNDATKPIAGGIGYTDTIIDKASSGKYTRVTSVVEYLSALSSAIDGDTIFFADGEYDFTNEIDTDIYINDAITVAGNRGKPSGDTALPGALLYVENFGYDYLDPKCIMFATDVNIRITGLRFRGDYSMLEGTVDVTDYTNSVPTKFCGGIVLNQDNGMVDNCKFWGFGNRPIAVNGEGCEVKHCDLQDGSMYYYNYGFVTNNDAKVTYTANYMNTRGEHGLNAQTDASPYGQMIVEYNIFGMNQGGSERHGAETAPKDSFHHNTYMSVGGAFVGAHRTSGSAPDTIRAHNNWCWISAADGAWAFSQPYKLYDNSYGLSLPDGLSARVPTAVIGTDMDSSSTLPQVIKFWATGSSDPNGTIKEVFWDFGDSLQVNNYAHKYNKADTITHSFNKYGRHLVKLRVVDNHGAMDWTFKTITIHPSGANQYVTFWQADRCPQNTTGKFLKQCYLEKTDGSMDWKMWEADVAYDGAWEYVQIDITDTLTAWGGPDSVTIMFRLYCNATGAFNCPSFFIDDAHVFGCNLINGNFENPADGEWGNPPVSTDGVWEGSEYTPSATALYVVDRFQWAHSGKRGVMLGRGQHTGNSWNAGDWSKIWQRIDVE